MHCSLLMGKARLAPLKPVTIPRMELSAAVLSTRLDRLIREELEFGIEESVFWTDSTCVLRYVENDTRRYQTFVANRVSAIREQSLPCQWKNVDTTVNPADDTSRGKSAEAIVTANCWINGPNFLWQDKETWPKLPIVMHEEPPGQCEISENRATFVSLNQPDTRKIDEIMKRLSSCLQLTCKKCIAWMLRFRNRLRNAAAKRREGKDLLFESKVQSLDVSEVGKAEEAIIKYVQGKTSCTLCMVERKKSRNRVLSLNSTLSW